MRSQLMRWGNSTAVRIPKAVLREAGMQEGDTITLAVKNGAIVARPVKSKPTLQELLAQISTDNVHREVEWGKPKGAEAW